MTTSPTKHRFRIPTTAIGLGANVLLSWGVLPFILPASRAVALRDFGEVILWQTIGMVGWPLALVGAGFGFLVRPATTGVLPLLLVLTYPAMLMLLAYIVWSQRTVVGALIVLHLLIAASFAAVWRGVLSGVDFMVG